MMERCTKRLPCSISLPELLVKGGSFCNNSYIYVFIFILYILFCTCIYSMKKVKMVYNIYVSYI